MNARILICCLIALGCGPDTAALRAQLAKQEHTVARAQAEYAGARARWKEMQDSLQIKIRQNQALGMDENQARAVEEALLESHRTTVKAAEQNLKHQRAYLNQLKQVLGSP